MLPDNITQPPKVPVDKRDPEAPEVIKIPPTSLGIFQNPVLRSWLPQIVLWNKKKTPHVVPEPHHPEIYPGSPGFTNRGCQSSVLRVLGSPLRLPRVLPGRCTLLH